MVTIYAARVLGPGELALLAIFQIASVLCGSLLGLRQRFSWRHWRTVIVTGLSMASGALILCFNTSIDRAFAASRLGVAAVGLVTVGASLLHLGVALWNVASYTIYSQLTSLHARRDEAAVSIERAVADLLPGGIWMSSAIQGVLFLVVPVLIPAVLPRYSECMTAAQVLVLAVNLFSAGPFFSWNLTVVGRQRLPVSVRVARLALGVAALMIAVAISPGLLSVAIGIVVGQLLYATMTALSWHAITGFDLKPAWQSLFGWLCLSAVAVGCAYSTPSQGPSAVHAAIVTYLALLIGLTLIVEHKGRTISRFWNLAGA
jgi:O-antigen/teichoic acid export membrane protein